MLLTPDRSPPPSAGTAPGAAARKNREHGSANGNGRADGRPQHRGDHDDNGQREPECYLPCGWAWHHHYCTFLGIRNRVMVFERPSASLGGPFALVIKLWAV